MARPTASFTELLHITGRVNPLASTSTFAPVLLAIMWKHLIAAIHTPICTTTCTMHSVHAAAMVTLVRFVLLTTTPMAMAPM